MERFSSAGEKIRYLRNTLGITQEELASEQISKSLISMIEKNKRNVTWYTATIIADSFNKYYKATGRYITAEFLMETSVDKARATFRRDIEKLEKAIRYGNVDDTIIQNTIEKIRKYLLPENLMEELAELQVLEGDYLYSSQQYRKALKIYLDSLDYFIEEHNYEQLSTVYIKIGTLFQEERKFETAIIYFTKAEEIAEMKDLPNKELYKIKCSYHRTLSYYTVEAYDRVFLCLEDFRKLDFGEAYSNYFHKIQLIEANTFRNIGNSQRAKSLYDKLLQDNNRVESETLFFLYENYAKLYLKENKINRALVFIRKALTLKSFVNSKYLASLYVTQAICYKQVQKYDESLEQLEYAYTLAQWVSNPFLEVEIHFSYFHLFMKLDDFSKAHDHLQEAELIILSENLKEKKAELYSYYIELNSLQNTWEKINIYADKLRA